MTVLQDMVVRIRADASGVASGVAQAKEEIASVGTAATESAGGMHGFLGSILGVAGGMAGMMVATKAFDFVKDQVMETITAGEQFQQSQAQTVQVLKSTGDASGMTAQGVEALADSLSKVTPISAETTQSAENMLLTFTNIGKNVFPQATQTALDMAQALGGDAKQQALQLGIALNDPEKGISRLTRVGVTFTQAQKDQISAMEKAGNMAGAQGVVLKELNKEFGGSAEAAGKTFPGALAIANNQLDVAREKIAMAFIPILQQLGTAAMPLVIAAANGLVNAAGGVSVAIKGVQSGISAANALIKGAIGVWQQWHTPIELVAGIITAVFLPALISTGIAAGVTGVTMAGSFIASTVAAGAAMVTMAATGIATAITGLIGYAAAGWAAAAATIAATWPILAIIVAIALLAIGIYELVTHWKDVSAWLSGVWAATMAGVGAGFSWLGTQAHNLWNDITGAFTAGVHWVIAQLLGLGQSEVALFTSMVNTARSLWSEITGVITSAITGIVSGAERWGSSIMQNLINGIKGMAGNLASAAKSTIGGALSNIPLVGKLIPHFAAGGVMAAAGLAVVGENGPELVQLPSGAQVYSSSQSAGMVGSGSGNSTALASNAAGSLAALASGSPAPAGGYQTANLYFTLPDGRVVAQWLGQPLVDLVRIRTGMKI